MSGTMLNEDRFSKHNLKKSFNRSFQGDKEVLVNRVDKNQVFKDCHNRLYVLEMELDKELSAVKPDNKRIKKIREAIENLEQTASKTSVEIIETKYRSIEAQKVR